VYAKLPATTLLPKILQVVPGLTAAFAEIGRTDKESESIDKNAIRFFFIFNSMKSLFD
jgi:hypothetical protein